MYNFSWNFKKYSNNKFIRTGKCSYTEQKMKFPINSYTHIETSLIDLHCKSIYWFLYGYNMWLIGVKDFRSNCGKNFLCSGMFLNQLHKKRNMQIKWKRTLLGNLPMKWKHFLVSSQNLSKTIVCLKWVFNES